MNCFCVHLLGPMIGKMRATKFASIRNPPRISNKDPFRINEHDAGCRLRALLFSTGIAFRPPDGRVVGVVTTFFFIFLFFYVLYLQTLGKHRVLPGQHN